MVHHPLLAARGRCLRLSVARRSTHALAEAALPHHGRCTGRAARTGAGLRATRRAAGRLRLRNRNHRAAGPSPTPIHWPRVWSGTPLGVPLHPVQAYAALAFLTLAVFLLVWQPAIAPARRSRRHLAHGNRRDHLHHRALARSRRPRRNAEWRARRAAAWRQSCWCWPARWCCVERKTPRLAASEVAPWLRPQHEFQRRTIDVPAEAAGQRLDQFLAAQLDGVSRSRVQLLLDQGDVLVNGEQRESLAQAARRRADRHHRRAASRAAQSHSRKTFRSTSSSKMPTWPWSTSRPA